jgi:hypothetical protein
MPLPPTLNELRRQLLAAAAALGAVMVGAGVSHLLFGIRNERAEEAHDERRCRISNYVASEQLLTAQQKRAELIAKRDRLNKRIAHLSKYIDGYKAPGDRMNSGSSIENTRPSTVTTQYDSYDAAWRTAQIVKAARSLFVADGTVEEALDAVIRGACEEFGCRIVVVAPARFIVDGVEFQWPEGRPSAFGGGSGGRAGSPGPINQPGGRRRPGSGEPPTSGLRRPGKRYI